MRKLMSGSFCITAVAAVPSALARCLPARAGHCGFLALAGQMVMSWLSRFPSWNLETRLLGALGRCRAPQEGKTGWFPKPLHWVCSSGADTCK